MVVLNSVPPLAAELESSIYLRESLVQGNSCPFLFQHLVSEDVTDHLSHIESSFILSEGTIAGK